MVKQKLEQSYEVKDLIEYKVEKGKEYFLVWWQGYPKKEATWEPKAHVQDLYDFQLYQRKLKRKYQGKNIPNPPKEESIYQSSLQQPSRKLSKSKKISKRKKQQENKQQSYSVENPLKPPTASYVIEQAKEVVAKAPKKMIEVVGVDASEQEEIKRKLLQSSPVKFQIKIKQFKQLPLIGQKIKRIGQSFIRGGKVMYQIELQNKAMTQPVILHQNYIKLLWPRQFAQHLISKIRQ